MISKFLIIPSKPLLYTWAGRCCFNGLSIAVLEKNTMPVFNKKIVGPSFDSGSINLPNFNKERDIQTPVKYLRWSSLLAFPVPTKHSFLDVWQGSEYFSDIHRSRFLCLLSFCSKLTICEICSKLTIKTPERHQWRRFVVLIANF